MPYSGCCFPLISLLASIQSHTHVHTRTHTYTHIHTYRHTHTHTHPHASQTSVEGNIRELQSSTQTLEDIEADVGRELAAKAHERSASMDTILHHQQCVKHVTKLRTKGGVADKVRMLAWVSVLVSCVKDVRGVDVCVIEEMTV